jgi:aspartate aminotransferase
MVLTALRRKHTVVDPKVMDINSFISSRVRELPASPTIAVAKEAQALRQRGVDVVDFGPGEPDFVTPAHVCEAAVQSLRDGFTHYAPGRGIPELRAAIARKLARDHGLQYDSTTEILVTPGAKQAVLEAVLAVAAEGDEVIVFDPGWGSYSAIVQLSGAQPVHVQLTDDFSIEPERLYAAISERTRLIIVGSPANPTGHVLASDELTLLAQVCRERDILLLSDEIYEQIVYEDIRAVSPASLPDMWERTITINGLSKAYAMTGWRLGYVAAPRELIDQMLKIQEQTVTTATSFAQVGGVAALDGPQQPIREMVDHFARRRTIVVDGLNRLPGVTCLAPDGAFYAFPDISGTGKSGTELAHLFLQLGVALTPGIGFGERWDTHVRLSFATSEERIRTGLDRMGTALSE